MAMPLKFSLGGWRRLVPIRYVRHRTDLGDGRDYAGFRLLAATFPRRHE
jgi:hypothetical protein